MHFSAKRGLAIACHSSVCPSVTLVICDHTGWKSWKLIAQTISPIPSLFVAKGGLIGTHQRSFEWYHPDPLWPPLPPDWGFATWLPPLISRTGKATDFKFGGYIYRANPNKSPLKIWDKMEHGRMQALPKFFGYPYYLRNG